LVKPPLTGIGTFGDSKTALRVNRRELIARLQEERA